MYLAKSLFDYLAIIFLIFNLTIQVSSDEQCTDPSSFNFGVCNLPPILAEKTFKSNDLAKKNYYCNLTYQFLNCMNKAMSKICKYNDSKSASLKATNLLNKINKAINKYNLTYQKYCFESKYFPYAERVKLLNYSSPSFTNLPFFSTTFLSTTSIISTPTIPASITSTESTTVTNKSTTTHKTTKPTSTSTQTTTSTTSTKTSTTSTSTASTSSTASTETFKPTETVKTKPYSPPKIRQLSIPNFAMETSLENDEPKNRFYVNSGVATKENLSKVLLTTFQSTVQDQLLEDECDSVSQNKCESRSLHITCGYPLANPNSNLNAYCNELKHYIRCAKCKTLNCKMEGNVVSIKKHLITQEAAYYEKCTTHASSTTKTEPTTSTLATTTAFIATPTTSTTSTITTTTASSTTTTTTTTTTFSTTTSASIFKFETSNNNKYDPFIYNFGTSDNQNQNFDNPNSIFYTTQQIKPESSKDFASIRQDGSRTSSYQTKPDEIFKTSTPEIQTTEIPTTETTTKKTTTTTKARTTIRTTETTHQPIITELSSLTEPTESRSSKSKIQEQLDKILVEQTSLIKSRNSTKTVQKTPKTTTSLPSKLLYEFLKNNLNEMSKIDHLLINFDHIDLKANTLEVLTSDKSLIFYMKIMNRTDIFKGIKNGAAYLHAKTNFVLNLNERASDLCLTSSLGKTNNKNRLNKLNSNLNELKYDMSCGNGWTVSFWIKVSNLNLFDKTIIKVDNLVNNRIDDYSKFFILKLSNFDLKIQFLFKRKLWTVNQNIIWKSEWTMITLTWSEFEGITIYVNDKKLLCQQMFEYYSTKEDSVSELAKNENSAVNGKSSAQSYNSFNSQSSQTIDQEYEKFKKRSYADPNSATPGVIYIGLNNKVNKFGRKFYWSYRDESSNPQSNVLLASSFSEAILIDELAIINYRMNSKEIAQIYLKEYVIHNDYDSVEEMMFLTTTDNKQSEIVPLQGALIKKFKDNWFLSLSGAKQFVIVPNLFDSCIMDAENLCSFGFTATVWLKFTYNFVQYPIEKNFEQTMFFFGSQDFHTGVEAILYIYSSNDYTNEYNYVITINFKSQKYTITKNYKVFLNDITQLNNLNCLTVQFADVKNLTGNMNFNWLNYQVQELDSVLTARISETGIPSRSFSSYSLSTLGEFGIKASVLSSSNSIGVFGDISKQSYFNVKNFELKNYDESLDQIEYDFYASNPATYEFNSLEKLFKMPNINIIGSPQLVETRYGKSLLFSKLDQKVILNNVTNSCFGDLNLCKNGYTLKLWVCFTNYNNNPAKGKSNPFEEAYPSASKNVSKRIYLLSNGGHRYSRKGMAIVYDLNRNQLIVYSKTNKKWYKAEVNFKLKLFVWYIITVTWDQLDGLRLYINNRLLDHSIGNNYTDPARFENDVKSFDFTLGKGDYDFDEIFETAKSNKKNPINFLDSNVENQTEDSDKLKKNLNKNSKNYQINSLTNNYYEFIIHKLVQYDVRKYPDEIISKNVIVQEKKIYKAPTSMNWLWYTISGSFLVIGFISLIILIVIIKRRASNGFWSREQDLDSVNTSKLKKKTAKLCCSSTVNDEDSVDAAKSNFNLELKQCNVKAERFHTTCDEYSTNSLYGTIDRLIVKKNVPSCTTSSQSAIMYTNNYNSITKDPKMRNSTSYIINSEEDLFEKSEIHF